MKFRGRLIAADTIALVLYSLSTGILSIIYELWLMDYSAGQWMGVRVLYNGLRYPGARLCGGLTDIIRAKLNGGSNSRVRRSISASIALSVYQQPIYLASALIMNVPLHDATAAMCMYLAHTILLGWWYGIILDWVRAHLVKGRVTLQRSAAVT